jgi:hypothetical protein
MTATAALVLAPAAAAGVLAYPSSQTIRASGRLPQALYFGHFVKSDGRTAPDALLPWNGTRHPTEHRNQPLYLQVVVPDDAKPGRYRARVRVTADGRVSKVPVSITVFPVPLPARDAAQGNLVAAFHVVPESYVEKVDELYRLGSNNARARANDSLFDFLSAYRISPAGWGFGEPRSQAGYTTSRKWWLDAAGNMIRQNEAGFAAMRIPISNQRTRSGSRIAGLSPYVPEVWCDYLHSIRSFWEQHDWISGRVPYLYALDEPGVEGMRLVARQAATAHECFPGAQVLVTGNPTHRNRYLWNNRGGDDVDIWAVLSRRYYGRYDAPRERLAALQAVRRAGKTVWSSTYGGVPGSPRYTLSEPLSDPRMFLLWNALEGIPGTLYAEGTTSYFSGDPFQSLRTGGEYVLLYPGPRRPIASARLEQIRDGIEDWDIFDIVRRRYGPTAVRRILGDTGLFSTTASGVILSCTMGCQRSGPTAYSWPRWSHDAATAAKIEAAHLRALRLASR